MVDAVVAAVEQGDLDELTRLVDGLCAARDWDGLVELRDRCLRAVERGKQLWPAAHHAEYRLALEAPAPWAAAMLVEGAGRFALGPLSEVAASTHTWAELAPHAPSGPIASLAAHERVVRGEDVHGLVPSGPTVLEVPYSLEAWEPRYCLAEYHAHSAHFPSPPVPPLREVNVSSAPRVDDPVALDALLGLVAAWTASSDGRAETCCVEGDALSAIGALGVRRARAAELGVAEAFAHMAWAAASGGAYGRRRGAATARFDAWLAGATLVDLTEPWPPDPEAFAAALASLRWYAWDAAEPVTGWSLHLAIEDPRRGRAWAIAATDAR